MLIKELISNLAILVSLLFLYTQSTKSSPLRNSSSLKQKVSTGVLAGILSNVLMQYSMYFDPVFIDMRHVPVVLVAYYGGGVPAIIAMLLTIIGRFLIGVNTQSILAFAFITATTVITLLIKKLHLEKNTMIFVALTLSNIIFCVMLSFLSIRWDVLLTLSFSYSIISYLAGFLSFYVIEFVRTNQNLLRKYQEEASTDGLTGLNNVRQFDEVFNEVSTLVEHRNERMSLLYIDIDHFKNVNDTYGHPEGDQVLIELSNILRQTVRSFDIVSRIGGEEFTIILLDCPADRGVEISEKIRNKVERHSFLLTSGASISITVSIGLACYSDTTNRPESLIEDADNALYEAKRTGRNKVVVSRQHSVEFVKT